MYIERQENHPSGKGICRMCGCTIRQAFHWPGAVPPVSSTGGASTLEILREPKSLSDPCGRRSTFAHIRHTYAGNRSSYRICATAVAPSLFVPLSTAPATAMVHQVPSGTPVYDPEAAKSKSGLSPLSLTCVWTLLRQAGGRGLLIRKVDQRLSEVCAFAFARAPALRRA